LSYLSFPLIFLSFSLSGRQRITDPEDAGKYLRRLSAKTNFNEPARIGFGQVGAQEISLVFTASRAPWPALEFIVNALAENRGRSLRRCEKMVYGIEVLHKTLSGALGASRLKLLGRIRRKPARLPPIWGFRPFPMILGSF